MDTKNFENCETVYVEIITHLDDAKTQVSLVEHDDFVVINSVIVHMPTRKVSWN